MADEELRGRLQEELEQKSRQALIEAADAMETAASTPHSDTPCSSRFIPPSYRVTVQNTGDEPLTGISVTVGDSEGIYWGAGATVDLDPGEVLSFMTVPEPRIRDVWDYRLVRMEGMATSQNVANWWDEYLFGRATSIGVTLPGHTECLGTCMTLSRDAHSAPPQLLTERYTWP